MTQEREAFEEWLAVFRQAHAGHLPIAYESWQASRAAAQSEFKAKLLSDEMVHKTAKALAVEAYHTFGLETLHNTNADDHGEKEFTHYISPAKAALEAIAREF